MRDGVTLDTQLSHHTLLSLRCRITRLNSLTEKMCEHHHCLQCPSVHSHQRRGGRDRHTAPDGWDAASASLGHWVTSGPPVGQAWAWATPGSASRPGAPKAPSLLRGLVGLGVRG